VQKKKTTQIISLGNLFFFKVVFMLPTSFLTVDISQYYHSAPLICVKKLVFSNISERIALDNTLPNIVRAGALFLEDCGCPFEIIDISLVGK
jgi:hypothetical protein